MNPIFSVQGKTILVTGGTRGIGRAITTALVGQGASVFANYVRQQDQAEELADQLGTENLTLVRADITREKGIGNLLQALDGRSLDGLVHSAATGVHAPLKDLNLRHWDWTMNLNARAFFALVVNLESQFNQGASIIGLSSEGAVRAVPQYTLVGASKAALESLCRHLAVEMSDRRIRANVLSPGSVLTDSWKIFENWEERFASVKERIPGNETVSVEEIARVAQFLCSDASSGINGQCIVVDRGERIVG